MNKMNFEEQLTSWEFYPTSLLAQDLECAVFPYLVSNPSNITTPQPENNNSELLKVLKFHSTLAPQEVQVCASNSPETPIRKDGELARNRKKKRRQEPVQIPTTSIEEDGEDGAMFNDKLEFYQSSKVIRRIFERKRWKRITDKMKSLRDLLPHCTSKQLGADSVLDKSIDYIRTLQHQIQSICTAGNLIQYASQMPLPVPQSSPYFPVGAGGYDFSTTRTSNMALPAASVPAVPGVPCNLIRPGMIFPQMLTGPYYPPQYQVQMPMFNPFQQMQPTSVPVPNMQQISFPMLTDPTQQSSMVHDFAANSLSCPQLSELSRRSENKGTKGNPLA